MSVVSYLDYVVPLCLLRSPAAAILLSTKPTSLSHCFIVIMLKINSSLEYFFVSTHAIMQEHSFVKSKALCYSC